MKIDRKKLMASLKIVNQVTKTNGRYPYEKHVMIDGENQKIYATDLNSVVSIPLEITDYKQTMQISGVPIPDEITNSDQLRAYAKEKGVKLSAKIKDPAELIKAFLAATAKETVVCESCCLPGKDLLTIIDRMTDEIVEIKPTDNKQGMLFDTALAFSIGNNFSDIYGMPINEYPEVTIPAMKEGETSKVTFNAKHADYLLHAALKENDNSHGYAAWQLQGFFCDFKENTAVATDVHRLHKAPLVSMTPKDDKTMGMFVPAITVRLAKSLEGKMEEITAEYNGIVIQVQGPNGEIIQTRCETFTYPNWKDVYYVSPDHMTIEKSDLEKPLTQAMVLSSKDTRNVKFKFNGGIDLEFRNSDRGIYQNAQIPIKDKTYGEKAIEVAMNGTYVMDALKLASKDGDKIEIAVNLDEPGHPIVFSAGELTALVMPCRM